MEKGSPYLAEQAREDARQIEEAREAREKAAMAESILAREEDASRREFDPLYRAEALQFLAKLPKDDLVDRAQVEGLGPLNLGDSRADLVFTPVTPCRVFDTRLAGGPITPGANRSFDVTGNTTAQGGANCGIPFGPATAALLNFVVINPAGPGDFRVTPYNTAMPNASFINYGVVGGLSALANGTSVTMCDPAVTTCTYDITIQADGSSAHVLADITGYFHKVRKEQVKSTHVVKSTGATTTIGTTCTNYSGGTITVTAPVAGKIVVNANVVLILNHVTGTASQAEISIGTTATSCPAVTGYDVYAYLPSVITPSAGHHVWLRPFKEFSVAAGTYTYYLNGLTYSGSGHVFWFAGLEATFIPN